MQKSRLFTVAVLLANGMLTTHHLFAQDGHYWTQHYGTKSMLLSNSVIGSVEDLGAIYYNPARLGLVQSPTFLISADAYEWNRYRVVNSFGEKTNSSKTEFGGLPSLTAGTFHLPSLKKHTFGYAILLRQNMDLNIGYREEALDDLIAESPGDEYFGGNINLGSRGKERWASLSWAYPISDRWSVGLTANAAQLEVDKGTNFALQALSESKEVAIYQFKRSIGYKNYGLLWKAGVASSFGSVDWGVTITTPTINIKGDGSYNYEEFYSGITSPGASPDRYATNQQSGMPAQRRTPLAIGAGFSIPIQRHRIHIGSEWYASVAEYTILTVEDHLSQSAGDTIRFQLIDRLNNVLNFGIGTEFYIKDKLSMYFSFSTDFSAVPEDITGFSNNQPIASNSTFSANLFHFGGGFVLTLPGADITLGAAYTGGQQNFARPVDFPDGGNDNVFDKNKTATLQWDRMQLLFSFSVPFLERKGEALLDKVIGDKKNDR